MLRTVKTSRCVLFISPEAHEHVSLREIFEESPWEFHGSFTAREGLDLLRGNHDAIPVVICEQRLPDGDWKRLLAELDKLPLRVTLIVSSRLADERLWAEVLNLGAFDLLLGDPFNCEEVLCVTESAWRAAARHREDRRRSPSKHGLPAPVDDTHSRRLVAGCGV